MIWSPSATILRMYSIKKYTKKLCGASLRWTYLPTQHEIFTTYKYNLLIILSWSHQEFHNVTTFYKLRSWTDLQHTAFIVVFNIVHPEDCHRRRSKHVVSVINEERLKFMSAFLGFFKTLFNARYGTHTKHTQYFAFIWGNKFDGHKKNALLNNVP
jgi:hypothetical protein